MVWGGTTGQLQMVERRLGLVLLFKYIYLGLSTKPNIPEPYVWMLMVPLLGSEEYQKWEMLVS